MSQTSWEAYVHIVQIIALWRTNNQHGKRHHYSGAITGGDFQAFSLFFAIVVEGHLMSECLTEEKKKVRIKDGVICQTAAWERLCGLKHSLIRAAAAAAAAARINTWGYIAISITFPDLMILFHLGSVNVNSPKTLYPSVLGQSDTL